VIIGDKKERERERDDDERVRRERSWEAKSAERDDFLK
jgi:hypothetical protein